MIYRLSFLLLLSTSLCCCNEKQATGKIPNNSKSLTLDKVGIEQDSIRSILDQYMYTDTLYATSNGNITIQNSYPKGGSIEPNGTQYFDAADRRFAYAGFWTRVINHTDNSLKLTVQIPADSFDIFTPDGSFLKLLLPKEQVKLEKLSSFNYGLTGMKEFLDEYFNRSSFIQKTIDPEEAYIFYVSMLTYQTSGTPRAAMYVKDQNLFYRASVSPHGSGSVPCGKIEFID